MMNESPCEKLDDYLDDLLIGNDRHQFERHLAECDRCCSTVSFQQAMFAAESASLGHVDVPIRVTDRAADAITRHQRRVWIGSLAGLAAVGMVAIVCYAVQKSSRSPGLANIESAPAETRQPNDGADATSADRPTTAAEDRPTRIRVQPAASGRQVALSLPTANEAVTMVMIYPTTINDRSGTSDANSGDGS